MSELMPGKVHCRHFMLLKYLKEFGSADSTTIVRPGSEQVVSLVHVTCNDVLFDMVLSYSRSYFLVGFCYSW